MGYCRRQRSALAGVSTLVECLNVCIILTMRSGWLDLWYSEQRSLRDPYGGMSKGMGDLEIARLHCNIFVCL